MARGATCQIETLDPGGADANLFGGFPIPVGRWVETTTTGLTGYSFAASPGVTYAIETSVGAPYAYRGAENGQATTAIQLKSSISSAFFPAFQTIDTDRDHGTDGCSKIAWTAPDATTGFIGEDMWIWVPTYGQSYDSLYVAVTPVP
ncbi:MAG TPA: hypothetical protein VN033_04415 [Vulgatibacter sp.]|nr:hypothetical protein [Vulgatibacter sp.]